MCPVRPNPFPGTHPDACKASTQLSAQAQALLQEQRDQNRHSPFVRSLMPTGQLTESSIPPHLNCSSPYLSGLRAQPTITHDHVQKNEEAPHVSTRYRIRYQDATDRDLDTSKRNGPESLPGAPRCFAPLRYGTESSTMLSRYADAEIQPSFSYAPKPRTRRVRRAVGAAQGPSDLYQNDAEPSYDCGPEIRTRLFRALEDQGPSGYYGDDAEPSYGYGPTVETRLVRRSVKVEEQPGPHEDQPGLSSSVGYITSTLLSHNPLNAPEQLSLSNDSISPTSSALSETSTLFSRSSLEAAEQPIHSDDSPSPTSSVGPVETNDDSSPHLQSASSFLVSTLTPAAFQSATYPTDKILYVKLGSRALSRIVPVNMSSEARARCDSGNPFVEGLLTNTVELRPSCPKGFALIEGVLMEEVAKILTAESLADLRRYDHGTGSLAELGGDADEKLQAMDGLLEVEDAGRIDVEGDGCVKESMPVHGMPGQALDGLLEDKAARMSAIKGEGSVKVSTVVQGLTYLVLEDTMHADAANAEVTNPNEKQYVDQEWEMVDTEMEDIEMAEEGPLNMKGYGEDWVQGWTLL